MPGFLMFEEFGLDPDMPMADLAKAALRMVPMSWVAHGVKGEFNVDVDPIAMLRGDDADLFNFGEAYKGWIAVRRIDHDIQGAAARAREAREESVQQVSSDGPAGENGEKAPRVETKFKDRRNIDNRGQLKATVEIDASLPQMIKAALDIDGKKAGKTFKIADLHMCTTAQIDVSQLTLGNNSPAAALIQTLVSALMFNIIPYLTISMRNVQIESINLNLEADQQDPPTADIDLSFQKVVWTYHVINGSNMNLLNVSTEYDFSDRTIPDKSSLSLGSMLNPFG